MRDVYVPSMQYRSAYRLWTVLKVFCAGALATSVAALIALYAGAFS